ncbi:hypothetical protein HY631_01250 [Candidatus Uhrbacteria bacterium]|nr:hypothetical protein [Candidatus Uhrbacteria bacterium]
MDPINARRLPRAKQRERAAQASQMLLDGVSQRRVIKELGYVSVKALLASVQYHRKRHGYRRDKGWLKLPLRKNGTSFLLLTTRPLRRCGWKDGQGIHWRIKGATILLRAVRLNRRNAHVRDDDPNSVAYYLHRVMGKTLTDVATELGVSRSAARRMALRHAMKHPKLPAFTRSPIEDDGIVSVHKGGVSLSLTLITPIKRLKWKGGDIVRWEYDEEARVLRVNLEHSAQLQETP